MRAGQALFTQGLPNEAIKHYASATSLAPTVASGWVNLGICLESSGLHKEALAVLQHALTLDASIAPCHQNLGRALVALNNLRGAAEAFETALRLRRNADTLNDYANLMRIQHRPAEAYTYYEEAIRLAPGNTLYAVNQSTCLVELCDYDGARVRLKAFDQDELPLEQREEIDVTLRALDAHERLDTYILEAMASADMSRLEAALRHMPKEWLEIDSNVMVRIEKYARLARALPENLGLEIIQLPNAWPEIEALFMIPVIDTPADYSRFSVARAPFGRPEGDWNESLNMTAAIEAMRAKPIGPDNPIHGEACMHYWHALACRDLEGFLPGHFKITKNRAGTPSLTRARPDKVTGSIRYLLGELANSLPPGVPRALVLLIGILDIHPFLDGNWRIATAMMNREFERQRLMPTLFTRQMGLKGQARKALAAARSENGDLGPLVKLVINGMAYAQAFVRALHEQR